LATVFGVTCLALFVSLGSLGCSSGSQSDEASEAEAPAGAAMGGPVVDINVTPEALDSKPASPDLTTPEAAVRSYLDWTSYAYRIGQSQVALPTMSTYQEVRVDSYVQYNLQKYRLIDQALDSLTFGTVSVDDTRAIVPAQESWTYRYLSIEEAGQVIEGPYRVRYEAIYTLVKNESGDWVVDSVESKALDEVR
jgi:hypothetical protein